MKKSFLVSKTKWLIVDVMKAFAYASRIVRMAIFGFAMTLFGFPAYASDQYLLVSNRESGAILRYNANTGAFVNVLVPAGSGGMHSSFGMTLGPDGNLYVASDLGDNRVLKFNSSSGEYLGMFASLPGTSDTYDLVFGPDGNLYVSDSLSSKVLRFDGTTGASMGVFATGEPGDIFRGITYGPDGNLYAATVHAGHFDRFDGGTGTLLGILSTPESATIGFPGFGPDGLLYAGNYFGSSINVYDITTGELVKSFSSGGDGPNSLAFTEDGDLLVANYFSNQIVKFEDGSGLPTVFTADRPLHGPMDLLLLPVPEPSTYAMLLAGLGLLVFMARRRKQNA